MTFSILTSTLESASEIRRTRTMREFAEEQIIIPPGGPFAGRYYSVDIQPYTGLWFDTLDASMRHTGTVYFRAAAVGPSQTGKTLTCATIPLLYHQFELNEDTTYGVPTLDMAGEKYRRDIRPVIQSSEFARFLPSKGRGSREGSAQFTGIDFTNGTALKPMPAGGGDKQRAGYTARVLVATEIDGYGDSSDSSLEGSKIKQMETRLRSYSVADRRIYLECTASVEEGAIWQEYINGSKSIIRLQCPHCSKWVTPEREHFKGWQNADTVKKAMKKARFHCPVCDNPWSDKERIKANKGARLEHTHDSTTFSFRWSAVNNLFLSQADIAYDEWHAARRIDRDNAEREMCQFVWAIPYTPLPPPDYITIDILERAARGNMRGLVPTWAKYVTVGCDVHKHYLYWVAVAWREDGKAHIVDYGTADCPSREHGEDTGMRMGLDAVNAIAYEGGWLIEGTSTPRYCDMGAMDCGYRQDYIVAYCQKVKGWWPSMGQGHSQGGYGVKRSYTAPKTRSRVVVDIGEHWHVTRFANNVLILQHNVDFGKLWVHNKLQLPGDSPGAMTLFTSHDPHEHTTFLKHLTSEQLVEIDGETKWIAESRNNHYLDALVLAGTAARKLGVSVAAEKAAPPPRQTATKETNRRPVLYREKIGRGIRTKY